MQNLKAHQRDQLTIQFGILVAPLADLTSVASPPPTARYRLAFAKLHAGEGAWNSRVREFATFAPDVCFERQCRELGRIPRLLCSNAGNVLDTPTIASDLSLLQIKVKEIFDNAVQAFSTFLDQIPVDWQPEVFEANTPFTAYERIRECVATAKHQLHYFDRYLKEDFFHLFLNRLDRRIAIRLATTCGRSGQDAFGVLGVQQISNLARQEFQDYALIELPAADIHDRNLRIDNHIFTLGPGVDRAGLVLTNFGPTDSSPSSHSKFDALLARGTVIHSS